MRFDVFFQKIKTYANLSPQAETAWAALLREKAYHKGDYFVTEGQAPKKVAFIVKGLFYQYYTADNGDMVVKYFFPENRIAGSMTAALTQTPGNFTIRALKDTQVLEYNFIEFKSWLAFTPISRRFTFVIWSNTGSLKRNRTKCRCGMSRLKPITIISCSSIPVWLSA